ncbi:MAG: hypothetical protein JJ891_15090 [Rhizobiaceae bacterium]|nr:hypothetical protein [Rhizobiaceae bacterium]
MTKSITDFLLKPLLILAVAAPVFATVNVSEADAGSRNKRAAIIAGAIIGGAIAYGAYKRNKRYKRRYYRGRYYAPRYYRYHSPRGYYRNSYHKRHGYRTNRRYNDRDPYFHPGYRR